MAATKCRKKRTTDKITEIVATVWLIKDNTKYKLMKKEMNAERNITRVNASENPVSAFKVQHNAK
jgi:hypothetical protein